MDHHVHRPAPVGKWVLISARWYYAVAYLANAYRVAGGNADRAVSLYSSGYYYVAKRQGMLGQLRKAAPAPVTTTASSSVSSPFSWLTNSLSATRMQLADPMR
jgi:hypothetical protein